MLYLNIFTRQKKIFFVHNFVDKLLLDW